MIDTGCCEDFIVQGSVSKPDMNCLRFSKNIGSLRRLRKKFLRLSSTKEHDLGSLLPIPIRGKLKVLLSDLESV